MTIYPRRTRVPLRTARSAVPTMPPAHFINELEGRAWRSGITRADPTPVRGAYVTNLLWKPSNGIDPAFPSIGVGKNDPTYQAHQALTNIVKLSDFDAVLYGANLRDTRMSQQQLKELYPDAAEYLTLNESIPTLVVDKNMIPLIWYFPKALDEATANTYRDEIEQVIRDCPKLLGHDKDTAGKGALAAYMGDSGTFGTWTPVMGWHPLGVSPLADPTPSVGLTSKAYRQRIDAFHTKTRRPVQHLNALLKAAEPRLYENYAEANSALRRCRRINDAAKSWYSVLHGSTYIFNRATPRHRDLSGTLWGKDRLLSLGRDLQGGALRIPIIGIRMIYGHGSCVILPGRMLEHEVEEFTGSRICAASFVHKSVMEWCGVSVDHISQQQIPACHWRRSAISRVLRLYE